MGRWNTFRRLIGGQGFRGFLTPDKGEHRASSLGGTVPFSFGIVGNGQKGKFPGHWGLSDLRPTGKNHLGNAGFLTLGKRELSRAMGDC
jgi:hypothetical protein